MSATLLASEFALKAKLPDIVVCTARKRAHRLAHLVAEPTSVWRRPIAAGTMPQLVRISSTTACGQTIAFAKSDPAVDDLPSCPACLRVIRRSASNGRDLLTGEVDF